MGISWYSNQADGLHTAPREMVMLGVGDVLDEGVVLPRLRLPGRDVFELGE